jgi:cytochrome c peroxidase
MVLQSCKGIAWMLMGRAWLCAPLLLAWVVASTAAMGADSPQPRNEPIRPLVAPTGLDPAKVVLGRKLFFDAILSSDRSISCATCHNLAHGGDDDRPHSIGVNGVEGKLNAPTVYNAAYNVAQFWDGRAATLEDQAGGPITNPIEMRASWDEVMERLHRSSYRREFDSAYSDGTTPANVRNAIATFERALVSVNSRFDRWLLGEDAALTADEKAGYALFKSYGCTSCHQGANVGGNLFQRFGFFGNWFQDRGGVQPEDLGRFNVTKRDSDKFVFKVPSLRMAVLTAPYFHDGSIESLDDAIRIMGRYQLGREITGRDVGLIAKFIATLPGEIPEVAR